MPENNSTVLEMRSISKNFPGVKALDDVSITLNKGEILGLLGENGAGKSTLIKILSGAYKFEKGKIIIEGEKKNFDYPDQSLEAGIKVIYQELTSFEPLTVAENIFAGEKITNKLGFISWRKMGRIAKEILSRLGSDINPFSLMENLTVAEKQMVEIAKAIHGKVKILVMDEPTSSLDEHDVENLYKVIRKLRDDGVAIIYITHRLEEIFQITDKVVVLRDGKKVGEKVTKKAEKSQLVSLIVGRDLEEQYPKKNIKKGKKLLEVKNLSYRDKINDVSFYLREGEIVSFFGLLGAGSHNLLSVIFGDKRATAGEIFIEGKKVNINHPYTAKNMGMGYIPLDRKEGGVALVMNVAQNITSANIENLGPMFLLNRKIEKRRAETWFNKLNIKAPALSSIVDNLSGGNQQKVVIAKWLEKNCKIFLMNEPTRGIDIGSKTEVYKISEDLCEKGAGVIMVSSELPEIIAISDRVYVMRDGKIVGEFETKKTTQDELMHYASA